MAWGILVPKPGIKPLPLHWKCRVLTTAPPGNSWFIHLLTETVFPRLQVHSHQECGLAPLPWFPRHSFPTVAFTPSVRVLRGVRGKCCLSVITEIVVHFQVLWKGLRTPHSCNHDLFGASLVAQMVKNLPASAGDPGSSPGLGRFSGEGNDNPLQYSCLENSMERGAWRTTIDRVEKSWTLPSDQHKPCP